MYISLPTSLFWSPALAIHQPLQEANEYIDMGCLNGLFVLGRTTGFIGHFLDQKRLKQGLYRHPWEDIVYLSKDDAPPGQ